MDGVSLEAEREEEEGEKIEMKARIDGRPEGRGSLAGCIETTHENMSVRSRRFQASNGGRTPRIFTFPFGIRPNFFDTDTAAQVMSNREIIFSGPAEAEVDIKNYWLPESCENPLRC